MERKLQPRSGISGPLFVAALACSCGVFGSFIPDSGTDRFEVGYFFDSMPRWRKDLIAAKLAEFGEQTCIDFVNLKDEDSRPEFKNRLKIVNGGGCWSYVGRHHKVQVKLGYFSFL